MPTPETRFVFDSTVIQLQPTLAQQHHRKQCNHAKRRVALAVPPFIHPDSLRRRLCTFSRLQKGQGSSKTPGPGLKTSHIYLPFLGFCRQLKPPTLSKSRQCVNRQNASCGLQKAICLPQLTHVAENTEPSRRRPIWKRACIFLSERGQIQNAHSRRKSEKPTELGRSHQQKRDTRNAGRSLPLPSFVL